MDLKITWLDLNSGEICNNDNGEIIALVEYEDGEEGSGYTGSISDPESDDLWFSAQCRSEDELLEEIEQHLVETEIYHEIVD